MLAQSREIRFAHFQAHHCKNKLYFLHSNSFFYTQKHEVPFSFACFNFIVTRFPSAKELLTFPPAFRRVGPSFPLPVRPLFWIFSHHFLPCSLFSPFSVSSHLSHLCLLCLSFLLTSHSQHIVPLLLKPTIKCPFWSLS